MKKIQLLSIVLLNVALIHANTENGLRGSIITQDNQAAASITADGKRVYPSETSLSPILGYVSNPMKGRQGLEKYADDYLSMGYDVHLNINMELQQKIESILDLAKTKTDADEVMTAVMESKTGKVLAIASSNRYDPAHITLKDIPLLNPKFAEYPYEPGSVMKPITLAIALDQNLLTPDTVFNTFNGKMEIEKGRYITDDKKFDALSATDIIVHSSNVGIAQISWLLTGQEFRHGLERFGFTQPSGIDLSRDHPGIIKPLNKLEYKMHRASSSYGYGMMTTFTQLLKAYNVFNNDGLSVTLKIINNYMDKEGKTYLAEAKENDKQVIGKTTSEQIHNILVEVVQRGTGVNVQYPGLEIGGKTATAHIAKNGRYVREYHSSFYGFANDNSGAKYTIGVLVIRAKTEKSYFASQSAVPVFKEIIGLLVENVYLETSK